MVGAIAPSPEVHNLGIASRAARNIARRKGRVLLAVIAIGIAMAVMISIPAGLNAS